MERPPAPYPFPRQTRPLQCGDPTNDISVAGKVGWTLSACRVRVGFASVTASTPALGFLVSHRGFAFYCLLRPIQRTSPFPPLRLGIRFAQTQLPGFAGIVELVAGKGDSFDAENATRSADACRQAPAHMHTYLSFHSFNKATGGVFWSRSEFAFV